MASSRVLVTEPLATTGALGNITNLTPERARRWGASTCRTLSGLQKGVHACAVIVGEEAEVELLVQREKRLKDFRVQLAQWELVVEVREGSY